MPRSPSPRRDYSRSRSRSRSPLESDTIRITRLSKNVLTVHLEEIFDVYGKILDIDLPIIKRLGTHKGTAWVTFASPAAAAKAADYMDGGQIDGTVVTVGERRAPAGRPEGEEQEPAAAARGGARQEPDEEYEQGAQGPGRPAAAEEGGAEQEQKPDAVAVEEPRTPAVPVAAPPLAPARREGVEPAALAASAPCASAWPEPDAVPGRDGAGCVALATEGEAVGPV
ncbi:hypothetical protein JCM10449v2_003607 [Rhodotorula kratochvilovae]